MKTVVITGANRGLGLEFARQYRAEGWQVIATARNPDRAGALAATGANIVPLDVGDTDSIAAMARGLDGRPIDLLINNAGLMGNADATALSATPEDWDALFAVNVLGPVRVTRALLPNLRTGSVAVTLGSQAGILSRIEGAARAPYNATKAAAHAVTISLGAELQGQGVLYFALRPGFTRTDMTGGQGHHDAADSVAAMRAAIAGARPDWAGRFVDRSGRIYPYSGDFTD